MKKKTFFASLLTVGAAVLISSNIAFAAPCSVSYEFRLPATGSRWTKTATKVTKSDVAKNNCTFFGWPGSEVDCWVINSEDGRQLSGVKAFYKAGLVDMEYYSGFGTAYWGYDLQMQIKTGPNTWHECDVFGDFNPST